MLRKTKIVCTLGPSTDDENILKQLMINGMNVARINMSHQTHCTQKVRIDKLKKLRNELNLPIALLLDTKGPEIRTGAFKTSYVTLKNNQNFTLTTNNIIGDNTMCSINFKSLPKEVSKNDKILIDDGLIELIVKSVSTNEISCKVINGGNISANKSINLPGIKLSLPFLNKKDRGDIEFAVKENFDFIAASFTRSADDIFILKKEINKYNNRDIKIIAKIENADGVKNIDEIINISDGIMVARGDLGVEIPLEEIPIIQKKIITKAREAGKQVITATQMLDSMMKNPRPTRAETTDVANAIYDGTSAIMLSGETAAGKYPVESIKTMVKIAKRTEADINYVKRFKKLDLNNDLDVTSAISHATCTTAHDLLATAIVTVSKSGRTAKMISKYRPNCPIICATTSKIVLRQINMSWGVIPILVEEKNNTDSLFEHVIKMAKKNKLLKNGDLIVITAGVPLGVSGNTNLMRVQIINESF